MPITFRLYRHYTLKILMVTDGIGSFGHMDFGLSEVLRTLANMPSWVKVEVTRAHRDTDPFDFSTLPSDERTLLQPQLQGFRFTQDGFDINAFDEVWLVGVARRGGTSSMSDRELRVLTQFMDGGGGVFATGDHEDLGYALSGRVPRVRSMRKWYWATTSGDGPSVDGGPPQPRAPDGETASRYDTLREGDPGYQFEDQSDTLPQEIEPVMRTVSRGLFKVRYPHPLLCSSRGIIRVLPDHPHEGECVVPTDLGRSYTFDGYTSQEYRTDTAGHRQAPEIVAFAQVIGGHETPRPGGFGAPKPPVIGRRFAVIGAYDGHAVNVGRVSVDATWHHFFNINLVGDPHAPTTEKRTGFPATASGQAAYESIKAYFRNIAVWLARPSAQSAMMSAAVWNARWSSILVEPLHSEISVLLAGTYARDALGRLASPCQIRSLIDQLAVKVRIPDVILPPVFPPRPVPPDPPDPWIDPRIAEDLLLGGVMMELAAEFPAPSEAHAKLTAEEIDSVVRRGAARGVRALRGHIESEVRSMKTRLDHLQTLSTKVDDALGVVSAD